MFASIRVFLWRHQRKFAFAYVFSLVLATAFCWAYPRFVPKTVDLGAVIASRSMAHQQTFREISLARRDLNNGNLKTAETRLEDFVSQHSDVQPSQIYAHSVADACDMLAAIYQEQNRLGRAERTAEAWAKTMPRSYRAWYVLGSIRDMRGDLSGAASALRKAFKLTLCLSEVADDYLAVLAELNRYEDILWVAREYDSAQRNAQPKAEVFVGIPRSSVQRQAMRLSGIPIGHGRYFARFDASLERGADRILTLPPEMFGPRAREENLFVLLRVENMYEDFRVTALRYRTQDGEWTELKESNSWVAYSHRKYSGQEYYAELRTDISHRDIAECEIQYSSPHYSLSDGAKRIIRRAELNVGQFHE